MDNRKANSKILKRKVYLYKMLICIFNQNYYVSALYLQKAIYIFKNGIRSSHSEISSTCRSGLNVLEKLSQPICSTLSLSNLKQLESICIPSNEVDESTNEGRSIFYDSEINGFNKKRKEIVSDDESNAHDNDDESVHDISPLSFGTKKIKLIIGSENIVSEKLHNQENTSNLDKKESDVSESDKEEQELDLLNNDNNMETSCPTTHDLKLDENFKMINQENISAMDSKAHSLEIDEEEILNSLNDVVNEY